VRREAVRRRPVDKRRRRALQVAVVGDPTTELARALADALRAPLGGDVRIEALARLTGGASRETWSFDAVDSAGATHPLILRRDFTGAGRASLASMIGVDDDLDRAGEFHLLRALAAAGLPVPRPLVRPDPNTDLHDCFIMARLTGEGLPQRLLRDDTYAEARRVLPDQIGTALADIHALAAADLPPLPEHTAERQIDVARRMTALGPAPRPVFELALRWLDERRAPDPPRRLVHGDFRNGNFLVGPEGLRAVLDWEFAHIGDPMEDVAFLCLKPWRFGRVDAEVGGFGPRVALYRAYERASGMPIDPARVRFWEILNNLKWGALCVARAMAHVLGMQRSVEGAAIGRRVAETEYDILTLMETE
jgi:aminoglycoside phosphotransferase (APT) family kinase protein